MGCASLITLSLSGCSILEEIWPGAESSDVPPPRENLIQGVDYDTDITGDLNERLRNLIDESSALLTQSERQPATPAALRRRMEDDVARFRRILRSEGYYNGTVETSVDQDAQPIQITIEIDPGKQFTLSEYNLSYHPTVPEGDTVPRSASDLGLDIGQPARAESLKQAESRITRLLSRQGYPDAELAEARYLADPEDETLRAEITVNTGVRARFGSLSLSGLEDVRESYIRELVNWPEGATYDSREVERVRQELGKTGLFSSVIVERKQEEDQDDSQAEEANRQQQAGDGDDGAVPVSAEVIEAPHRSIGAGVNYSTDAGPGVDALWEHRNLFGENEKLRLEASVSRFSQQAEGNFRKPNFLQRDQSLLFENKFRRETSDAYDELTFDQFLGVERPLGEHWTARFGPRLTLTQVEEDDEEDKHFFLAGVTGSAIFDNRDDPLNPTKGLRFSYSMTPLMSLYGESTQYIINDASVSSYLSVLDEDRLVLAGRVHLGSIIGASQGDVPANQRFYAGGGGSVRGYPYQAIGPLDEDDDPEGGRALFEMSLEARFRVTDSIGVVPFIDAGQVYETSWPTIDNLRWAAGLGLRYYTGIGPLRLDVAVPLNRRPEVDDPFQFYVSIGQSF
ncbi:MAG: autotransporter assembly complex protein TamA [Pseudomonadota bacterium]